MIKKIVQSFFAMTLLVVMPMGVCAQEKNADVKQGGEILSQMGEKLAAMGDYRIDFELEMQGATDNSKGFYLVNEPRYLISIDGTSDVEGGMKQGFDGEKVWTFDGISKEIAYDNYNPQSHNVFENPTKAFDFAEELFTLVSLKEAAGGVWSITLRPNQGVLDGIEYVELCVDKKSLLPTRLGYDMAGARIYINIAKITPVTTAPTDFAVEVPQGYEVIDFR